MEVGGWLRRLGLEQYEAAFRENEISEKVLPNLTAEDLKDLGVGMVGHRRVLLDAIAALRAPASEPAPLSDAPLATDNAAQDTAERRQVTVMFSDLVGSTALSVRMDPEDLREVISTYQKSVAETVRRHGGFVAKYMGDGVLIYFGYPQAHEDDAERAVRAGLQLIAAVTALKSPILLQTRVGIATGLVVVGDLIGSGEAQEHASSVRPRTSRRACKGSPSRIWWSSPKEPGDFLAICLSSKTSGRRTSRASPGRREPGRRCASPLLRADSRQCMQPA
jgi:Adenylate and Guanylate cyclase catalytic domain/SAM domain (Sterile alpha motif)